MNKSFYKFINNPIPIPSEDGTWYRGKYILVVINNQIEELYLIGNCPDFKKNVKITFISLIKWLFQYEK